MSKNNSTNNLFLNQPVIQPPGDYTAAFNDVIIEVNTTAPRMITLPAPSAAASTSNVGKFYVIKDISGLAGTNNITIVVSGGGTIDGASNSKIQTNYGSLQVYTDGTSYYSQALWVNPSAYNTGVWFSYTPTTTGLVIGNAALISSYLQIGKMLFIQMHITAGSTSGTGSGTYTWSIPTGFTIDLSVVAIAVPLTKFSSTGTAYARNAGARGNGFSTPITATSYGIYIDSPSQNLVNSGYYGFISGNFFSAFVAVPII